MHFYGHLYWIHTIRWIMATSGFDQIGMPLGPSMY